MKGYKGFEPGLVCKGKQYAENTVFKEDKAKPFGSSGYGARIGSSGDDARIGSSGYGAVIMCAGNNSKAKAKKGSWITLAEWKYINDEWAPVCVKTEQVDGERIKEDTFYQLKGGEFVECE